MPVKSIQSIYAYTVVKLTSNQSSNGLITDKFSRLVDVWLG